MKLLASTPHQDLIDELDAILDQEKKALQSGELDKLQRFLERKEQLVAELNDMDFREQETLSSLQSKIERNQELLGGAIKGIKAVAQRFSELRRVRKGLDVYNSRGKMNRYTTSGSLRLERRA